jgi:hypothetical protein
VKGASEATTDGNTTEAMTNPNPNPNKETRNFTYGINFNKVNYGTYGINFDKVNYGTKFAKPSGPKLQSTYGNQYERSGVT